MKYKFYLKPDQQGPECSTSFAMSDGGIVWIGEKWKSDIEAHEMSAEELSEYNLYLEYQKSQSIFSSITFDDFKKETA